MINTGYWLHYFTSSDYCDDKISVVAWHICGPSIHMSRSSKVANKVMFLLEECLQGNYDMVSKLQIACSTVQPTS